MANMYQDFANARSGSHNKLNDTFMQLAENQRQEKLLQAANIEKQRESAQEQSQDPAYIASLIAQGEEVSPHQQMILERAQAKDQRIIKDEMGNVIRSGEWGKGAQKKPKLDPVVAARISSITNPVEKQAAIDEANQTLIDPSLQGVANSPFGQKEMLKSSLQQGREISKEGRELDKKNEVAKQQGLELIRAAKDLKSHKGLDSSVGMLEGRLPAWNQDSQNFRNMQDQVLGKVFLQARDALKGAGQVTDFEGTKGQQAMSRLNSTSDEADYKDALDDLVKVTENSVARMEGKPIPHDFSAEEAAFRGEPSPVNTQAEFDALPSGAVYLEDGVKYRKP